MGEDQLEFGLIDQQAGSGERRIASGLFGIQRNAGSLRELVKLRSRPFVAVATAAQARRLDYNHLPLQVPRDGGQEVIVGEIEFDHCGMIDALLPKRLDVASGRPRRVAGVGGAPVKV